MPQTDTITNNAITPHNMSWMPFFAASSPPILARYDIKPQKKTTIAMVMKRKMTPFRIPSTRFSVLSTVTPCAKTIKGRERAKRARAEKPIVRARIKYCIKNIVRLPYYIKYFDSI